MLEVQAEKKKLFAYSAANGCLTNLLETTSFRNSLDRNHYQQVSNADEADVIFVNTCGYNSEAEKRSMDHIEEFQKKFPNKKVIVSGCLPRINKEVIRKSFSGPVIPSGEIHRMNEILNEPILQPNGLAEEAYALDEKDLQTRLSSNRSVEALRPWLLKWEAWRGSRVEPLRSIIESSSFDGQTFAISVARGCLGKCNYCAIKKAKGRLVSRPLPEVVSRVQKALMEGYTKIHLLGDDIGCWGQDLNLNSSHLLSAILRLKGDFQLVINYFDPTWLNRYASDLKPLLTDSRILCVNIPIQSGSNEILAKMDRDYRIEDVLRNVGDMKELNPNFVAKTHIMVGYPGETWAQFFQSLKMVFKFDLVFPNKFGPRPGTPAEKMQQIPESIRVLRFTLISSLIFIRHAFVFVKSFARSSNSKGMQASYGP